MVTGITHFAHFGSAFHIWPVRINTIRSHATGAVSARIGTFDKFWVDLGHGNPQIAPLLARKRVPPCGFQRFAQFLRSGLLGGDPFTKPTVRDNLGNEP